MSGHAFQKITGMRFAVGQKGFVSHPSSNQVTQFYRLTNSPFWKAKHKETYVDDHFGTLDWQSNDKVVTWTFFRSVDRRRYAPPTDSGTLSSGIPPTYLYSGRKRSKQHSEFIVGCAYWSNKIRRYLAVTIDQEYESTLKLWSTERLADYRTPEQAADWELISTLGTLGADEKLNTSVFFNQDANEAVAVVSDLVTVGGVAPGNRRLRISVTIDQSDNLQASMIIEDPYSDTFITTTVSSLEESNVCGGTTLIASDYQVLRNAAVKDELVDLVVTIDYDDRSSFDYYTYEFEEGGITYYYYTHKRVSSLSSYSHVTKIIKADNSSIEVMTSSGSTSANLGLYPSNLFRSSNTSYNNNRMFDMDLRTCTFLIENQVYSTSSTSVLRSPGAYPQTYIETTVFSTEEKKYTVIRYEGSSFEEENQWSVSVDYDDVDVLYTEEDLQPIAYSGQFQGSSNTWYLPYGNLGEENFFFQWITGQLRSLILKDDDYYFLSGRVEDLYTLDLENGDPVAISGFNLTLFNVLSVI